MKKIIVGTLVALMTLGSLQGTVAAANNGSNNGVTVTKSSTAQGPAIGTSKDVVIKSPNYSLWNDFSFSKVRNKSDKLYGGIYHVKCYYNHKNGSTYYSVYDSNSQWMGYINKTGVKEITKQGMKQNVSIKTKKQSLWNNLAFSTVRNTSSKYYDNNLNLIAKVKYHVAGGNDYYSVYDNNGAWQGYINTDFVTPLTSKNYNKKITITNGNYSVYNNFFWVKRGTGVVKNGATYTAKVSYQSGNGNKYLSLYNGNNWIGYINKNATKDVQDSSVEKAVKKALSEVGKPYSYGAAGPNAFDCSGLTQYSFKGVRNLRRTTTQQEYDGKQVSTSSLKRGDLIFWGARGSAYHVAIYLGNNQYVHAPKPGDKVKVAKISAGFKPSFGVRV